MVPLLGGCFFALVGVAGFVWLVARGQWPLVLAAIPLAIAMPPVYALLTFFPTAVLIAKSETAQVQHKRGAALAFGFLSFQWSATVAGAWVVAIFQLYLWRCPPSLTIPSLMAAPIVALAPIDYMWSQEGRDSPGSDVGLIANACLCLILIPAYALRLPLTVIILIAMGVETVSSVFVSTIAKKILWEN